MVLGIYTIVAPYFRAPKSSNWVPLLQGFSTKVGDALYALPNSGLSKDEQDHARKMLQIVQNYIDKTMKAKVIDYRKYQQFAHKLAPLIQV
jgi:NH3-dependent NAD+ synthetase